MVLYLIGFAIEVAPLPDHRNLFRPPICSTAYILHWVSSGMLGENRDNLSIEFTRANDYLAEIDVSYNVYLMSCIIARDR